MSEDEREALINDRDRFNEFIYTPLEDALVELQRRWQDPTVKGAQAVPQPLAEGFRAVLFRQLVTSNYEVRRFVSIVDSLHLRPLFWEYYADKFTSNNEWKHSLGKLFFYEGRGKQGGMKLKSKNVVDFNKVNGKPFSDVQTLWGQPLIEFHHELYQSRFRNLDGNHFDASDWLSENGKTALSYYESFLSLFLKHGILFENFMLDAKEFEFTRDVFFPAFCRVYAQTGLKPLVVALEPTDIEGDQFWICHPDDDREFVEAKLRMSGSA